MLFSQVSIVCYSDQGGAEVKLEPEKLSGLDPHHSTQLCFHPPTGIQIQIQIQIQTQIQIQIQIQCNAEIQWCLRGTARSR